MSKEIEERIGKTLRAGFCVKCQGEQSLLKVVEENDGVVETVIHCSTCEVENTAFFHM